MMKTRSQRRTRDARRRTVAPLRTRSQLKLTQQIQPKSQSTCCSSSPMPPGRKKGKGEEHVWSDKEVLHLRELVKDYFRKSGVPRRKATLYRDLAISMNLKYQNTADYVLLDEAKVKEKFRGIWTSWKKHGPSKDMDEQTQSAFKKLFGNPGTGSTSSGGAVVAVRSGADPSTGNSGAMNGLMLANMPISTGTTFSSSMAGSMVPIKKRILKDNATQNNPIACTSVSALQYMHQYMQKKYPGDWSDAVWQEYHGYAEALHNPITLAAFYGLGDVDSRYRYLQSRLK